MNRVQVAFRVSEPAKTKVNVLADSLGLSQSQVVEMVLKRVEVDAAGHVWVGDQLISAEQAQEELPLAKIA